MKINRIVPVLITVLMFAAGCGKDSAGSLSAENSNYDAGKASNASDTAAPADAIQSDTTDLPMGGIVPKEEAFASKSEYDVDLTQLSASMVYAQVYDMVNNGNDYLGKSVKVKGPFAYFQETDGREFFAVLISDATACCSQGIEFVLDGDYSYPKDYPPINTEIVVTGEFNYYKEGNATYCQLLHASMEADTSLSW